MEGLITTICLTAYALGWANAEQVCLNADTIVEVSERYDIQPEIIVSLVYHESRWNPRARSRAGACGLTQVLPKWTRNPRRTCSELMDNPEISLDTGAKMLYAFLNSKRYADGNLKVALCAYNAGYSNCKSYRTKRRSNTYGKKVIRTSKTFREKMLSFDPEGEDEVF